MRAKPKDSTWTDEQWEAIIQKDKNIIVSAGAGSGKTAVLTTRIIDKIEQGIHIDELIVLTFTEAAAFEMKTRVRSALQKKVKEKPELQSELEHIDQATITTFDSFSLSLLKKYHYLMGIDHNIHIADRIVMERKKREILDQIFDELYKQDENFYSFLNTFTLKDDEDVKKSLLELMDKLNILYNKDKFYDEYEQTYFSDEKIQTLLEEYESLLEEEKQKIIKMLDEMEKTITHPVLKDWFAEFSVIGEINQCKKYDDYKEFLKTCKLKAFTTSKKIGDEEKESAKERSSKIRDSIAHLQELTVYESSSSMIERYILTKDTIQLFLKIFRMFDSQLKIYKEENNLYEFSDITRLSIQLLEQNPNILNEIKSRTKEIMIDEYQDTNDIGDYFISLISDHNVYMVGDIKQSIYGFRNANPQIFKDKYDLYSSGKDGYKIDLNKNFRSRREVLDAINFIFEKVMDLDMGGADYSHGHEMIFGNTIYDGSGKTKENSTLEILNYSLTDKNYRKEEIEAFIIALDIQDKMKSSYEIMDKSGKVRLLQYKDICILMDRKTNFDLYKKIFTYLNIPLTIHKDEDFVVSDEIFAIKSILALLLCYQKKEYIEKYGRHALLSVARSFLFSYDDATIFEALSIGDLERRRSYLKELYEKMELVCQKISYMNLTSLLKEIYLTFDLYHKIYRLGNVELTTKKLDYLLSIAESLDEASYTLEDFVHYFEDSMQFGLDVQFSVKAEDANSVHIMTIHKSKGLEFPLLYCSGLYKSFSKEDVKSRYLYTKNYGIIVPSFDEGICYSFVKDLFKIEHQKEDIGEKIRLFYVALTRAREKVILVGNFLDNKKTYELMDGHVTMDSKMNYTSFYDILCSIEKYLKPYMREISLTDIPLSKAYEISLTKCLTLGKKEQLGQEKIVNIQPIELIQAHYSVEKHKISQKEKDFMSMGNQIHEYLEYLNFNDLENEFVKYSVPSFYQEKIQLFCTMPWFEEKIIHVYKEYEFMYVNNDIETHGIIDLLLETEHCFIIIDYKLKNIDKEEYVWQVQGYMNYIKSITHKKVCGYLYSILNGVYKEI